MLSEPQKRNLRRLGHRLRPVVILGQAGLSAGVRAELERAFADHELVKVRINAADRAARAALLAAILEATRAELVQRIGHVALLYRRNPERPRIDPDAGPRSHS
ncbi:YhbY family RNA-binding protein [Inmirania thermothiophila]|uniref:RNA-binding protein n=1 Tax=Inmirania thermothiophila TaxID=1750597 RepID=A0A3N1XZR1_9GAMM|nr:YhbY family RNA-binding protein [Inmirania thermothiophila]ROR32085.1 RNA-binding protein [Inmirania thermothiophila]